MCTRLPGMSDVARKRTLADWVVKTKKQVVKLYAVAKWSRDADVVQKCMVMPIYAFLSLPFVHVVQNITAFLMGQNRQFDDVTGALKNAKDALDPARQVYRRRALLQGCEPFVECVTTISSLPSIFSLLDPICVCQHASRYVWNYSARTQS